MSNGGAIRGLRRHRFAIGLIAAYGLLLSLLISALPGPAAASTNVLDAFLAQQICATGSDSQHGSDPANPASHHNPDCSLCGTSCPMGGCAPVSPATPRVLTVVPVLAVARVVFHPAPAIGGGFRLYPSDAVSQAPPVLG